MTLIRVSGTVIPLLLALGGIVAGIGQGIALRAGGYDTPQSQGDRASVTSMFFLILYQALVSPVIRLGRLPYATKWALAGTLFSAVMEGWY